MSSESSPVVVALCDAIRGHHRERVFAMDQRKRLDNATGAFVRLALGWRKDADEADRKAIAKAAADLVKHAEAVFAGKVPAEAPAPEGWTLLAGPVLAALQGRAAFDTLESSATKAMEKLAVQLPVWAAFAAGIRGFGARSLAVLVGEAGPLGDYRNHSNLWKRMGLAVMEDGKRQGNAGKGASAETWIAHGYNARRRAAMFVIGECLMRSNGDDGPYRSLYLARKAFERERAEAKGLIVAPSAKIPAARKAAFMSDGQIDLRARRYMERRMLKHLWQAWRRVEARAPEGVIEFAPAAEPSADEAESRVSVLTPKGVIPRAPGPLSPADGTAAGLPKAARRVNRQASAGIGLPSPAALHTPALVEEPA